MKPYVERLVPKNFDSVSRKGTLPFWIRDRSVFEVQAVINAGMMTAQGEILFYIADKSMNQNEMTSFAYFRSVGVLLSSSEAGGYGSDADIS